MSRHHPPATEGEIDRLLLIAPRAPLIVEVPTVLSRIDAMLAASRPLDSDEDDALTSPRRDATLERLGVTTVRRGRR